MSNLAKEIITIAIPTAMPIAIGMMALKMIVVEIGATGIIMVTGMIVTLFNIPG